MKITAHCLSKEISFVISQSNFYIFDNPFEYNQLIHCFFLLEEGNMPEDIGCHIVNDTNDEIPFNKIGWINDPYHFKFKNTKVINGMTDYLSERQLIDIQTLNNFNYVLKDIQQKINQEFNFPITYSNDWNLKQILSSLKVNIDYHSNNIIELIYQIIDINHVLKLYPILIFTNINSYIHAKNLQELQEYCTHIKETVLFISYEYNNFEYPIESNVSDKAEIII